jgi:uracil-DNA glycosylase family 4
MGNFVVREKTPVYGYGPLGAKIMILGECPTYEDEMSGKPFTKSRELDSCLRDVGIIKQNCWLTTVSKLSVTPNTGKKKIPFHVRAKQQGVDMDQQLSDLQNEINSIKPNAILGIGKTALWALTGETSIDNYRGSILMGMGRKFIPTYNPEHLGWQAEDVEFIGYWNRQLIMADLRRFYKEAATPDINLPQRQLQICHSSAELRGFLDLYRDKVRMSADIEAGGTCIPICVGLAFNSSHGMTVPLWNVDGISSIPDSDLVQCWILLAKALAEKDIIGQNFNYDRDKILRLGFVINRLISDTMMKAQALHPELPKALASNQSIYTREPFYKGEGMYHGKLIDLLYGCARDACVTYELDEVMEKDLIEIGQHKYYYNFLMKLPEFYWGIERQGFQIDKNQQLKLMEKYVKWSEKLQHELYQITGAFINTSSWKQVDTLIYENWKLGTSGSGTGEEEITKILNSQAKMKGKPEQKRGLELILEKRRVDKTIGTYLMALPDYDGRMKTTYFPCLETGRSKTGQLEEPLRPEVEVINYTNGKKIKKAIGTAFQTMTKHGDIGQDVRSQFIPDSSCDPDDPYIFLQADSAQAEARVVFLLAEDEWALEAIDKHDFHALTASWFFGGTEDDHSKKKLGYESPIRFAGKTLRHAGHLGASKRRAAISVNTDARKFKINIAITEADAERSLKIFHAKQPRIQQVFQASVIRELERTGTLCAPIPWGFDSNVGGRRQFFERPGDERNRQAFSYIPQRSISDNTKGAGLRIKERIPGIKIVLESHDSLLFCIRQSQLPKVAPIVKQEMERPIDFRTCSIIRRPLVIPCELEVGFNYQEMTSKHQIIKPYNADKVELLQMPPKTLQEKFTTGHIKLTGDSHLDDVIYREQMKKLGMD